MPPGAEGLAEYDFGIAIGVTISRVEEVHACIKREIHQLFAHLRVNLVYRLQGAAGLTEREGAEAKTRYGKSGSAQ